MFINEFMPEELKIGMRVKGALGQPGTIMDVLLPPRDRDPSVIIIWDDEDMHDSWLFVTSGDKVEVIEETKLFYTPFHNKGKKMFTWKIASKSNKSWNHNGQATKIADAVKAMKLMFDECKKDHGTIPDDLDWGVCTRAPKKNQEDKGLKPRQ